MQWAVNLPYLSPPPPPPLLPGGGGLVVKSSFLSWTYPHLSKRRRRMGSGGAQL